MELAYPHLRADLQKKIKQDSRYKVHIVNETVPAIFLSCTGAFTTEYRKADKGKARKVFGILQLTHFIRKKLLNKFCTSIKICVIVVYYLKAREKRRIHMEAIIREKIREIEEQEQVTVLFAAESGSRAWGFASKDSDYDVRFVYKRRMQDYLRLQSLRDVIEWQLDEVLDINGWDVDKALKLMHASNPTLLEWCHSPIFYYQHEDFGRFKALAVQYFDEQKCINHYLHMAEKNFKAYLQQDVVKMKKYFYVLRPLFAAMWIRQYHTTVPILFTDLMEAMCPSKLKPRIAEMVERKKRMTEQDVYLKDEAIHIFIVQELEKLHTYAKSLRTQHKDWTPLDEAFLQMIR